MLINSAIFIKSSSKLIECPPPDKNEYAFIGRSNVGKSSLINMLVGKKKLAKTSSTPGKTKLINHFLINDFWNLVDLPGYGYAKVSKFERYKWSELIHEYVLSRTNLLSLFVLIDCRHEPLKNDLEFLEWLGLNEIPFVIVFTKSDKLKPSQLNANIEKYKKKLLETWEELPQIFITSAEKKTGRDYILEFIENINRTVKI